MNNVQGYYFIIWNSEYDVYYHCAKFSLKLACLIIRNNKAYVHISDYSWVLPYEDNMIMFLFKKFMKRI